jgi:hypothetical protein
LDKIRKRNRPHATQKGVKDHHQRTYDSSKLYANTNGYAQDQTYGKHLGTDPTKVGRYEKKARHNFCLSAVKPSVKIPKGQKVKSIQGLCKE